MKFLKSERGKDVLVTDEGYWYLFHSKWRKEERTTWRCRDRAKFGCSALITIERDLGKIVSQSAGGHTHASDWGRIKAAEALHELKEAAKSQPNVEPMRLLQEIKGNVDEETALNMGKSRSLARLVQAQRQKRHEGTIPKTMDEVGILPGRYANINGQRFLLADTGPGPERQLIFATDEALRSLKGSTYWISDGT